MLIYIHAYTYMIIAASFQMIAASIFVDWILLTSMSS